MKEADKANNVDDCFIALQCGTDINNVEFMSNI